jgi:hypothetical protein
MIITPIILLFLLLKVDVRLNGLLALLIAGLVILYINHRNQKHIRYVDDIYKMKKASLQPKSEIIEKYDDIVDYLFSVQDLYGYNPQAFEAMVDNISAFLQLYEDAITAHELAGINYGLAEAKRSEAANNMHSIIYQLPDDPKLTAKLEESIATLKSLLSEKTYELYTINRDFLIMNGYNTSSVVISIGPKPRNQFEHEYFDLY